MEKILNFYDNFNNKLIDDYLNKNKRIESAIINLSCFIPENANNILDIGCGLGWSSHEFANHFQKAEVKGIDLSPVLIETASKLFNRENLSFQVFDITNKLPEKKYDAVVMIDVYEHIPTAERKKFHISLKNILANQGRLILACPSKFHQEWLRNNDPYGLQPIDEDVDVEVIQELARDIGGEIIFFEYQNIWRSYDYFYTIIELNPVYNSKIQIRTKKIMVLEQKISRIERVNAMLGLNFSLPEKKAGKTSRTTRIKNKIFKILNLEINSL